MRNKKNFNPRTLALGIAIAALAGTAQAQVTSEQQSAIRANCRSDFMAKCSGVTPGGKDALLCLQKNVDNLSPGCKTAVSATIPPPAKPAEAPPVAPPAAPTAKTEVTPPPAPPASVPSTETKAAPAVPPKAAVAQPAKKTKKPATASAEPVPLAPPTAAAEPPATEPVESAQPGSDQPMFAKGAALIAKACARYLVMHCRGAGVGEGREVACLVDYVKAGHFVGPRCKAVLKVTGNL